MRNILKLGIFLLVVAGLAGFGIAYVNEMTSPVIAQQAIQAKIDGLKEVYPQTDEVKDETEKYLPGETDTIIKEINVAYRNNEPAGVIYTVEPDGYNGKIRTLVAFDIAEKKITALKVLSQKETPGLGANCASPLFTDRFKGKDATAPLVVVKSSSSGEDGSETEATTSATASSSSAGGTDSEVEAITAATVTTNAVVAGVNEARVHFLENFVQ